MPDEICNLTARVVAVEVQQGNDSDMIRGIREDQIKLIDNIDSRLDKEENIRWKMAASVIGVLVIICIGLISVIYGSIV